MSGMEDIQAQIQSLQTSVRRQRFAIVGLATLLAGSVLLGAVSPAGDATFDTITCEEAGKADYGEPLATDTGLQSLDLGLDVFHAGHCAGAGRAARWIVT